MLFILWTIIVHAKIILAQASSFGMSDIACIFIHLCAHGGVGGFSFPPYTPSSCACVLHSINLLTHYHSSQMFSSCVWRCRKLLFFFFYFFFFFSHTTICMCHPIHSSQPSSQCHMFLHMHKTTST